MLPWHPGTGCVDLAGHSQGLLSSSMWGWQVWLSERQVLLEPFLAPTLAWGSCWHPVEHGRGTAGAAWPLKTVFSHLYSGADGVCSHRPPGLGRTCALMVRETWVLGRAPAPPCVLSSVHTQLAMEKTKVQRGQFVWSQAGLETGSLTPG